MERKQTPWFVYVILIAVVVALGIFIVQRLHSNAEDKKAIDKTIKAADDVSAGHR